MDCLGFDFGTTNSVFARADDAGGAQPLLLDDGTQSAQALRTVLAYYQQTPGGLGTDAGLAAIRRFLADPEACRFLQSIKTFAASPLFEGTTVYGKRFKYEDLMQHYVRCVRRYAGAALGTVPRRLVVGRPVVFAGGRADPELALRRYDAALAPLGFEEILYVHEPVAAAFYFARTLQEAATVLVADLGGGTSDFSIVRFTPEVGRVTGRPLAHAGVGVAGDQFDFRIIDQVILPHLGKGSTYSSMGKTLEVPPPLFAGFARWSQLSVLKGTREFREIKRYARLSNAPEKMDRLVELIEEEHGYALYKCVSEAKARLSQDTSTTLRFAPLGRDFAPVIEREAFDTWIAGDLARIEAALDDALRDAGVGDAGIDRVFLTGGTSLVPAVRTLFERRFGAQYTESGSELLSIAGGLALVGQQPDAEAWATHVYRAGDAPGHA